MDNIRKHLREALKGDQAHPDFASAVKNFPPDLRGKKPKGASHTGWQLLEHLRIAQHDILEFSRDPGYVSPKWPEGYWPADGAPPNPEGWDDSIAAFEKDHKAFNKLIADAGQDLMAPFPHGDGQTLLREAMLIVDHNAYHIGQLVMLRVQLGIWPG